MLACDGDGPARELQPTQPDLRKGALAVEFSGPLEFGFGFVEAVETHQRTAQTQAQGRVVGRDRGRLAVFFKRRGETGLFVKNGAVIGPANLTGGEALGL